MLIIDMPMPVNCRSCPFSSCCSFCEGYDDYCVLAPKDAKYEWNFSDGKEPKERPDWCPIKGELVLCKGCVYSRGECIDICGDPAIKCVTGQTHEVNWFCAFGERDDLQQTCNNLASYLQQGERKDGEHEQ